MLDLNTLSTFTISNGIYGGVNKPNFKSIELWLQTIKENNNNDCRSSRIPNVLGLFGPASTGKTTTASVVAKSLNQPLITINCAALEQTNFWQSVFNYACELHPESRIHSHMPIRDMYVLNNCVVLLDECHELSNRTQGQLLTTLDGSINPVNNVINKTKALLLKDLTWILSTTDSGKLLYPLSTRLHSIVFNEYSENDVVEIVKLNYPMLTTEPVLVLSRAAKLIPRVALDLTRQYMSIFRSSVYTRETALSYVNSIKQTNEYGLDFTDKLILDMLKNSKLPLSKSQQLNKALINKRLDKFDVIVKPSEEELTEAINLQNQLTIYEEQEAASTNMARSRQDISTFCRLYDMRDLEMRLGYMEKLGVIARTKSGILWKKEV